MKVLFLNINKNIYIDLRPRGSRGGGGGGAHAKFFKKSPELA